MPDTLPMLRSRFMEGNRVKENVELLQALQMRVSKLEAQARRWRALSVLVVLAGVLLMLVGAGRSETAAPTVIRARTVEARDFVLKDEHGRVRARLSSHPTEEMEATVEGTVHHYDVAVEPALQFFDANGEQVWVEPRQTLLQPIK
jgi:hypothetical protein